MSSPTPLLQRGDIVVSNFPFTDLSSSKRRPALVLATMANANNILAFISSVMSTVIRPYELPLSPTAPDFRQTGLKVPSILRFDKLVTIDRTLITRRIGRLSKQQLQTADDKLIQVLGIDLKRYQQEERSRLAEVMTKQGLDALLRILQQK